MKNRPIAVGPGAASLMLIALVLALSVLGMLTLFSARSAEGMSLRAAEVAETEYALYARAERTLAQAEKSPGVLSWQEEEDGRTLECEVEIGEDGDITWLKHRLTAVIGEYEEWN